MRKSIYDINYKSILGLYDTQKAIKFVKDTFQIEFSKQLNLSRVTAPLFVDPITGLNDNLSGSERPVSFDVPSIGKNVEIVQSLAKWKRAALSKYDFYEQSGLYTDMNAIRRDEDLDFIHSVYVDQWDWEKRIVDSQRTLDYLFDTVRLIFKSLKYTEEKLHEKYPSLLSQLPEQIKFISTKELEELYPSLSRKEREDKIAKEYKAVFLYQIGNKLSDGMPHDSRAADYDDWNLNGDLLVYYELYDMALELSSMGIRVNKKSLLKQLKEKDEEYKINNEYCQSIINSTIPLSIGGGIGQSRLCMFLLHKAHIGEVQVSLWNKEELEKLSKINVFLL